MDSTELRRLIQQPKEGVKLEFKSQVELEGQGKAQRWNEFIKDIIALTNGNIDTANEKGYLIIGAADKLEDGRRNLHDVCETKLSSKQILDKVNTFCDPPIQGLDCEIVPIDGKNLLVITIHPSNYLHELKRHLKTPTQEFPEGCILLRHTNGEEIYRAGDEERARIRKEKRDRNKRQDNVFYKNLTDYSYIEFEIKEGRLFELLGEYSNAFKPIHCVPQDKQENLRLIQATLRSCQEILTEDSSQLASQLIGRLTFSQSPDIQEILDRVRELQEEQGRYWLEPLSSSLQPPIASLLSKIEERKPAQAIAVDTNSSKLVAAFSDGILKIWDLDNWNSSRICNKRHTQSVNAIAITPNNERLVSASDDFTLKIWDVSTGNLLHSIDAHEGFINAIVITSDGQQIISASDDSTLKFWNLVSGECMDTKPCGDAVTSVVATNDDHYIAFAVDTTIHTLKQGSKEISLIQAHDSQINFLLPLLDQHNLISASDDKTLKLWDIEQQVCLRELEGFLIVNAAIASDGKSIIFSDDDGNFGIWYWQTNELDIFEDYRELVNALIVTPDGKRIITASSKTILGSDISHMIYVWDLASKQCLVTLPDHTDTVSRLAATLSGQRFISASNDKTLRVWDLLNTHALDSITKHTAQVDTIVVAPNGEHAVSASTDQTLKLWRVSDGANLRTFNADGQINHMLIDDQRVVFATDKDNNLFIQDFLSEDVEQKKLTGHTGRVTVISLTPDGQYAISASEDEEDNLKVWSLNLGDLYKPLKGHTAVVTALTIDSEKQWLISVSANETLVWNLKNFELLYTFKGKSELSGQLVENIPICPKEQYLVTSKPDSTDLNLWDLSSGKLLLTLKECKNLVTAVAIDPDRKQVISTAFDNNSGNNLKVLDIQSNGSLRSLIKRYRQEIDEEPVPEPAHSQTIKSIAITPCGRYVISASEDHTLKAWDFGKGSNEAIATFIGESEMIACAIAPDGTIIVGEKSGRVHFLKLWGT